MMTLSYDRVLEFWAIEDNKLIKVIIDKQSVFLLEEVLSTPELKQSKTGSLPQSEARGVDVKPTKLSLAHMKPYSHSHQRPQSNGPLKDTSTNSSALLKPKLQCFSKLVSSPEQEKVGKGVVPGNTDASTQWAVRKFNE